ncbi:MAG TPA: hypothetical protein VJG29_02335 [Candidatus Paceibacterota bacterium]
MDVKKELYKTPALLLVGFGVGILLGGFFMWGWSKNARELSPKEEVVSRDLSFSLEAKENSDLAVFSIKDQQDGFVVAVSRVAVDEPTWVVIYEDNGGQPGNALGAARFTSERTSGTVNLLRGTLPQSSYYGVLHADDGDRIFSLERDFPLRDEKGNPLMVHFMTH